MKKRTVFKLFVIILVLMLALAGCQAENMVGETTAPESSAGSETTTFSQGDEPPLEIPSTEGALKSYELYRLYSTNCTPTDDGNAVYETVPEMIERPLSETIEKPEMLAAGKKITIQGNEIDLTYHRSYNLENSTRFLDIYYGENRQIYVGLDEETQQVIQLILRDGAPNILITETVQTEEQVVSACREFLRQYQPDIDRYTPKVTTVLKIVNEGLWYEEMDGFHLPHETEFSLDEIEETVYQVNFEYYLGGILTNDWSMVKVRLDGSLDTMARYQTGDFIRYEDVTVDAERCRSMVEAEAVAVFEALAAKSSTKEYVSCEIKEQLIVVGDYMLLLYEIKPTFRYWSDRYQQWIHDSPNPLMLTIPVAVCPV